MAEACWKHKDKLIDVVRQGDTKKYRILDMVLIKECQFCKREGSESEKNAAKL